MANKTSRKPKPTLKQTGNVCHVVQTFCGVPCAVETFPDEKAAMKRYEEMKAIMLDVRKNEKMETEEKVNEKTRGCKTSCSGLPWFVIRRDTVVETLSVVRGPIYEKVGDGPATHDDFMPFVAVCMDEDLQVTLFESEKQANDVYDKIRKEHEDSSTFEEYVDPFIEGKRSFSVDSDEGPSVMLARAPVVKEGQECQIV